MSIGIDKRSGVNLMEYWLAEQEARLRNLPRTKRYLYEKSEIVLQGGSLGSSRQEKVFLFVFIRVIRGPTLLHGIQ